MNSTWLFLFTEKTFIPRYVRINTLNCTKHEFYKAMSSHFKLTEVGDKNEVSYEDFLKFIKKMKKTEYVQDFHLADLYVFHPKANLTLSPLFIANKIILQDKVIIKQLCIEIISLLLMLICSTALANK